MRIVHTIKDGMFQADNLETLKSHIEKYYEFKGYKPNVTIEGDFVIVDVDTDLLDKAEEYFHQAAALCSKGRMDDAKQLLDKAIKICPAYSEAYRLKAQIAMEQKYVDLAIDLDIEALKADPNNVWALILMGNLLARHKRNLSAGRGYFDRALEIDPKNGIAINNLAGLLYQNKEYDEAIKFFDKSLELDDTYANSYYGKALVYSDKKDYRKAFSTAHLGCLKSKALPENANIREHLISMLIESAKQLVKQINYQDLIDGVLDIIYDVDPTPVKFVHDENQYTQAHLEYYAYHRKNRSIIKYKHTDFTPHFMLHELAHLDMANRAKKAGKLKVVGTSEAQYKLFERTNYLFFSKLGKKLGKDKVDKFEREIFQGITLQLMNAALDLFVEQKVYNLVDARPIQLLSLLQLEQSYIEGNKKYAKDDSVPQTIKSANKVLQLVGTIMLKKLYGIDLRKQYEPTKIQLEQAQDLFDEYEAYEEDFKDGDEYDLVDYFAFSLRWQDYLSLTSEMPSEGATSAFVNGTLDTELGEDKPDFSYLTPEEKERQEKFEEEHGEGRNPMIDMMMSMYMLGALEYFDKLSYEEVHKIAFQIAMLGVGGIDPNKKGYEVLGIPGKKMGGYELLAYYYVSWKLTEPEKLPMLRLPFDGPYETAKQMFDKKKGK